MRQRGLRTLVVALFVTVAPLSNGLLFAQSFSSGEPMSLEKLLRIWKPREDAVQTLQVDFTETRFVPRGSQIPSLTADRMQPFPPQDTTVEVTGTIWIDPERWRVDSKGPKWHPPASDFVEMDFVNVFDGQKFLSFFGCREPSEITVPKAYYGPPEAPGADREGWTPTAFPWLITFRNSLPIFHGISRDAWRLVRQTAVIDGRECYCVEQSTLQGTAFNRCWIDPKCGHSVVRREVGADEFVMWRDEVSYRLDTDFGWVPESWRTVVAAERRDGTTKFLGSSEFRIDRLQFNIEIDAGTFNYQLPPGAVVQDETGGPHAPVNRYVIQNDNQQRPILDQEIARGATYHELASTAPGQAGRPTRETQPNFWLWGALAVLAIALGRILMQRATSRQ